MGQIDDIFCSRCYRPLSKTGPLCESCSDWDYSGNPKYTQSQLDDALARDRAVNSTQAKYIEELREEMEKWKRSEEVYRTNADVFVSAERERCESIILRVIASENSEDIELETAIDWLNDAEAPFRLSEWILQKIREGK